MNASTERVPTVAGMKGYLRTAEAGLYLSVSTRTIRQWCKRRLLVAYRPTRRTCLFRVADLDAAMARFQTGGVA